MKENKYDEEIFFQKYGQMLRSRIGLSGAGEWETLRTMFPDVKDKRFLDLGCGYGWHCRYVSDLGAADILGVDISKKMIQIAKEKSQHYKNIRYLHCAIEEFNSKNNSWDMVFSSLAIHYLESFHDICQKVSRFLVKEGIFLFSVEHPVFTAEGSQNWIYKEDGEILCFPVDDYYYEGKRTAHFLGEKVIKYHRTLTTYVQELKKAGFYIEDIVEPKPPKNMIDLPGMKDEMRRPMMLIIKAKKI